MKEINLIKKIWASGNSLVITIPDDIIKKYHLHKNQRIPLTLKLERKLEENEEEMNSTENKSLYYIMLNHTTNSLNCAIT